MVGSAERGRVDSHRVCVLRKFLVLRSRRPSRRRSPLQRLIVVCSAADHRGRSLFSVVPEYHLLYRSWWRWGREYLERIVLERTEPSWIRDFRPAVSLLYELELLH